jgi:hypothetical protein
MPANVARVFTAGEVVSALAATAQSLRHRLARRHLGAEATSVEHTFALAAETK